MTEETSVPNADNVIKFSYPDWTCYKCLTIFNDRDKDICIWDKRILDAYKCHGDYICICNLCWIKSILGEPK